METLALVRPIGEKAVRAPGNRVQLGIPRVHVVALILLATACGGPASSPSLIATATAAPTPDPQTAPPTIASAEASVQAPSPSASEITPIELAEASVPEAPYGAAQVFLASGSGLVAIGFDGGSGSFVWQSADVGRTWTAAGQPQASIIAVGGSDGRYVGVGGVTSINMSQMAAISLSDDGTTWEFVLPGDGINGSLYDVVGHEDGFVAVGQGWHAPGAPGAWVSPDGRQWVLAETGSVPGVLMAVTRGGPGLVAVGSAGESQSMLATWTSSDGGRTWTIGPELVGGSGVQGHDIAALGDTLVIVGHPVMGGDARIWTSTDGVEWTQAGDLPAGGFVRNLVPTNRGLVAVGGDGTLGGRAWISSDGSRWEMLVDLPNAVFQTGVEVGSNLLIGGASQFSIGGGSTRSFASVWIGELEP